MCGINGFIINDKSRSTLNLELMNDLIFHRGPDDSGIYNHEDSVFLGMRRLAIIDIKNGIQPLLSQCGNYSIVFNGEIYNFKSLRSELCDEGVVFVTNSDTEVILLGFIKYGASFFTRLNGMFSFAIHDLIRNKVVVARDRLGEKPLYYSCSGSEFVFTSELKSLLAFHRFNAKTGNPFNIDYEALKLYFSLTYIPAPYTIYKGIFKLLPGHFIEFDLDAFKPEFINYWDINGNKFEEESNFFNAKSVVKDLLYNSVENRLISDVPIGSFLSGGIDSSIVSLIASELNTKDKLNTFSLGFENKKYDETSKALLVSKHINSNHNTFMVKDSELLQGLDDVILNFDEPFADSSAIPSYILASKTKNFVKVALTGDGGDEVFGGYNKYHMASIGNRYRNFVSPHIHESLVKPLINKIPLNNDNRGFLFKIKKVINSIGDCTEQDLSSIILLGYNKDAINNLFRADIGNIQLIENYFLKSSNLNTLNKARYLDLKVSLEGDMLVKVDRTSMLASLECRCPLLDHRLVEYSFKLPESFLINKGSKKYILKEIFKDKLPNEIFNAAKTGFGVPVGDLLRGELKNELIHLTSKGFLETQNLFNIEYIETLIYQHINFIEDHTFKLWSLYCFQKWYSKSDFNQLT